MLWTQFNHCKTPQKGEVSPVGGNSRANSSASAGVLRNERRSDRTSGADQGRRAFPLWKRTLDILFVTATAPVWLPLMLLIAAGIKITSPGCILFKQERVGFHGRRFTLFKFRSMKPNVESKPHEGYLDQLIREDRPMTKLDERGDPRIIPLGRILRASGLDELPQLFNILRGDMSLVGPRPCTAYEAERYADSQRTRFDAPPGLTGYWQVNGKNKTTFSEMVAMDIHYAENMSLWLDLKIILKTIPTVFRQVVETIGGNSRGNRK